VILTLGGNVRKASVFSGGSSFARSRRAWVIAGAIISLSWSAVGAVAITPAGAAAATHMVPAVLAGLPLATPLGAAPSGQQIEIGVSVQHPNPAAEQRLYAELYNPASPIYRRFLTPAQFDRRFGVPTSQRAAVAGWLQGAGLHVLTTSPAGDYFTATGSIAQMDSLFHVSIGEYVYSGQHFYANDVPPSVPNALPVDAIVGLDNVRRFTINPVRQAAPAAGHTAVGPQAGTEKIYTPQELWGAYNDPGAAALTKPNGTSTVRTLETTHIDLGQGQTMGIFGDGETSSVVAQLRLFESAMGFPKVRVRTVQTEGAPDAAYGDNTPAVEWYIDSQSSTGMAPDVSQLDLYFGKSLFDADVFADFNFWANDPHGPRQMNASFGECEANPTNPVTGPLGQLPYGSGFGNELEAVGNPVLQQAAIEGRTVFAASGDTGSGCPELVAPGVGAGNGIAVQPVPMVSYPCASPFVVCVGGTVLSSSGSTYPKSAQRTAETSWTNSGGGPSYFTPAPGYQAGVANVNQACVSTPTGTPYDPTTAPICRGVPDVSDLSGNVTGDAYFIYIDGAPSSQGGTSLASPLMMGQWARIQAAASAAVQKRGGLGFADETIYRQASSADRCTSSDTTSCTKGTYARDFLDVTQSEFGAGNGAYQPGPGWDYTSGWGALNVANFCKDVNKRTTATKPYSGTEAPAVTVTTATMSSPVGNATDPLVVTAGNDPSLDLTRATLSASASKGIVATLSGPSIGALPPADAGNGVSFFVAWQYNGVVSYARANESPSGSWTFTSGNTGTYGDSTTYGYKDTASSAATGSVNTATGTITIHVPGAEVGHPTQGSFLLDPQAFDQLNAGTPAVWLALTTDSSDGLRPVSKDLGASVSKGLQLVVAG
jgi:subtilase family serine protease